MPDRKGLVAAVASALYRHGANITHADQHQDHEAGCSSCAWNGRWKGTLDPFREEFAPVADELNMRWRLALMAERPRVAIFVSQYLHCLVDLLHRQQTGELNCTIPLIISNHAAAAPLAQFYGAQFRHMPVSVADKAAAEAEQLRLLRDGEIDLVVLARYMQILPAELRGASRSASSTCTVRF